MNPLLLLLAPISPAQQPQPTAVAAELAPMPALVPDAKQMGAWLADLSHEDGLRRRAALDFLIKAGPRAKPLLPELMKHLNADDRILGDALEVLAAIGPDAKQAVPTLMALLRPEDMSYLGSRLGHTIASIDGPKPEATLTLLLSTGRCTPNMLEHSHYLHQHPGQVVPHLVALCADKNESIREKAATVLATLNQPRDPAHSEKTLLVLAGDGAKGIPAALERLLADESPVVRIRAAVAIAEVAPQLAEKTIPVVIAVMSDKKTAEKVAHVPTVSIFRPIPDAAAKELIPLFDSTEEDTRWFAIYILANLPVQKSLEEVLKNGKTARSRQAAAVTFSTRYPVAEAGQPALKAALRDPDFAVRFAAAEGLVRISKPGSDWAAAAVPVLIEGLRQPDKGVRYQARCSLVSVGKPAKAAVPELVRMLTDGTPEVARDTAFALVEIAPTQAAGAVPILALAVKDGGDGEATRAANSLAKLGGIAKAAVPELVKRFDAKDLELRLATASAAARIDPTHAGKATEVLIGLLKEPEPKDGLLRVHVTDALLEIGPAAKAAVPTLLELLKDKGDFHADIALAAVALDPVAGKPAREWMRDQIAKDKYDAYDLAHRLSELGSRAKPFIPELVLLLESKRETFRTNAAETLGLIGPDAKAALPILKEVAAKDPMVQIRSEAAAAIKKIAAK